MHFPAMEPVLVRIDRYLGDEELFHLIKCILSERLVKTLKTGRNSTPMEVVIRMLVVKRLYQYSYAETERYVSDSLVLQQFCQMHLNPMADDPILIHTSNLI